MADKKLDEVITNVACILDALMILRKIYESGSCNNCEFRGRGGEDKCDYQPQPGQLIRFNCPFYEKTTWN